MSSKKYLGFVAFSTTIAAILFWVLCSLIPTYINSKDAEYHSNNNMRLDMSPPPKVYPLSWNSTEGAYMLDLYLDDGVVATVLDSGSSSISLKSDQCTWKECDNCAEQACPT